MLWRSQQWAYKAGRGQKPAKPAEGANGAPRGDSKRQVVTMPMIGRTAPGESASQGLRAGVKRPVGRQETTLRFILGAPCESDGGSICRTAVFVTRTHGGVGGGSREAFSHPGLAS